VIGGLSGALPRPSLGRSDGISVTGAAGSGRDHLPWTPRISGLALFRSGDYARAGVPMLPVVRQAQRPWNIFAYTLALVPRDGPAFIGLGDRSILRVRRAGCVVIWQSVACCVSATKRQSRAKRLFGISLLYLFALFAALIGGIWRTSRRAGCEDG